MRDLSSVSILLFNIFLGPVKSWNIFYNYLIYRPEKPDENHDHIYLVDLENENSMSLIEDPAP